MTEMSRRHHHPGQRLEVALLEGEQEDHSTRHRLHNVARHVWGIVEGLALDIDSEGRPFLAPGIAVDGLGREILVDRPLAVPAEAVDGAEAVDVWLTLSRERVLSAAGERRIAYGQSRSHEPDRGRERCRMEVRTVAEAPVDPDLPLGGLAGSGDVLATATAETSWPVYIGRVRRTTPAGWRPLPVRRRYAGLRGAWLEDGTHCVRLALNDAAANRATGLAVGRPDQDPVLGLTATGGLELAGALATGGAGLVLGDGALTVAAAAEESPTDAPRPWSVSAGPDGTLRIALGGAAGRPAAHLRIGRRTAAGTFEPLLTVAADGSVTVEGDLVVATPPAADPVPLDAKEPRYVAALSGALEDGLDAGLPPATGDVEIRIAALSIDPRRGRLMADVVLLNLGLKAMADVTTEAVVATDPGVRRRDRLWPRGSGSGGTLIPYRPQLARLAMPLAPEDRRPGNALQLTVRATMTDATGARRQAFAMAHLTVPS